MRHIIYRCSADGDFGSKLVILQQQFIMRLEVHKCIQEAICKATKGQATLHVSWTF